MENYKDIHLVLVKTEHGRNCRRAQCYFYKNYDCKAPQLKEFDCDMKGCCGFHWEEK